ncbi:MFS transporter [Hyphomonas sp.]|jgi:predicted MFS family arabinose efflux permease|uniref:MFS transporter n=1 Tax=Hyphomonas sp. TaxID=87 RepID=UPI0037BF24CE
MTRSEDTGAQITLWAAVAAATIGVLFYNVMPVFLGSLQDSRQLSGEQIGFVASTFFFGFNLVSGSAFFWIQRVLPRTLCLISGGILLATLCASALAESIRAILALTFVVGGASGALAGIAAKIISESQNTTLWYGIKVAAESAAGVVLLFVLPATLIPEFGFQGTVIGMILVIVLLGLPILWMRNESVAPNDGQGDKLARPDETDGSSILRVWLALIAMLVIFIGGSAIWAFEERIAARFEFDSAWVGMVLGLSLAFAVIGPLAAGSIGKRFGLRLPFVCGALIMIIGVVLIGLSENEALFYAVGACLFMLGWGGAIPFLFSSVAMEDPTGRYIALTVPALGVGSMIGPSVAGFLYDSGSITGLQTVSIAMLFLSALCVWIGGRKRLSVPAATAL